jgi:hypothetical protein
MQGPAARTAVAAVTAVRLNSRVRYGPVADEAAEAVCVVPDLDIAIATKEKTQASATASDARAIGPRLELVASRCTNRLLKLQAAQSHRIALESSVSQTPTTPPTGGSKPDDDLEATSTQVRADEEAGAERLRAGAAATGGVSRYSPGSIVEWRCTSCQRPPRLTQTSVRTNV